MRATLAAALGHGGGGEAEERGGGRSRERGRSERGVGEARGVTGASRRSQAGWEGGGGRGAWPRAPPSSFGARGEDDRGSGGGLGRWRSWARLWWAARVRPGNFLLSLSFISISVLFSFI